MARRRRSLRKAYKNGNLAGAALNNYLYASEKASKERQREVERNERIEQREAAARQKRATAERERLGKIDNKLLGLDIPVTYLDQGESSRTAAIANSLLERNGYTLSQIKRVLPDLQSFLEKKGEEQRKWEEAQKQAEANRIREIEKCLGAELWSEREKKVMATGTRYKIKDDQVFTAPSIPKKKVSNALSSYAVKCIDGRILLLIDETIFGSAKKGILLTSTSLYTHTAGGKQIKLADVKQVSLNTRDGRKVIVNGNPFCSFTLTSEESCKRFVEMLQEIIGLNLKRLSAIPQEQTVEGIQNQEELDNSSHQAQIAGKLNNGKVNNISPKSRLLLFVLFIFLWPVSADNFYLGRPAKALLFIGAEVCFIILAVISGDSEEGAAFITAALLVVFFMIWLPVRLLIIMFGGARDRNKLKVKRWL